MANCWLGVPSTRTFHGAVLRPAHVLARLVPATAETLTCRRFADEEAAVWLAQRA